MTTDHNLLGKNLVGIVLAGGLSSRMARPKHDIKLGGKRLIDHALERLGKQCSYCLVNANVEISFASDTNAGPERKVTCLADTLSGQKGPLAGILTGLEHIRDRDKDALLLTVPVDSPFFPHDLAAQLFDKMAEKYEIVVARSSGVPHPVFGLWKSAAALRLRRFLQEDRKHAVRAFLDTEKTGFVDFPLAHMGDPFFNINTPDDLKKAEDILTIFKGL